MANLKIIRPDDIDKEKIVKSDNMFSMMSSKKMKAKSLDSFIISLNKSSSFGIGEFYDDAKMVRCGSSRKLFDEIKLRNSEENNYCIIEMEITSEDVPFYLVLDKSILYSYIDIKLGGKTNEYTRIKFKPLTDLEKSILNDFSNFLFYVVRDHLFFNLSAYSRCIVKSIDFDVTLDYPGNLNIFVLSFKTSNFLISDKKIHMAFNPQFLQRSQAGRKIENIRQIVSSLEIDTVAEWLRYEHPQVIAAICSIINSVDARNIIKRLPSPLHSEIYLRLTNIERLTAESIEIIFKNLGALSKEQAQIDESHLPHMGGLAKAVDILKTLSKKDLDLALAEMRDRDESLYELLIKGLR